MADPLLLGGPGLHGGRAAHWRAALVVGRVHQAGLPDVKVFGGLQPARPRTKGQPSGEMRGRVGEACEEPREGEGTNLDPHHDLEHVYHPHRRLWVLRTRQGMWGKGVREGQRGSGRKP